jgi:hypothetical protein
LLNYIGELKQLQLEFKPKKNDDVVDIKVKKKKKK